MSVIYSLGWNVRNYCYFRNKPQHGDAQPLTRRQARRILGPDADKADLLQAQKLFTCEHGVTLNWSQARKRLRLE
jgi:hypothetical protein